MELIIIFLLGISVGSFLNVLVDRLPRDESVISGSSYCEFCKHKLSWNDLIPLLSFIMLRGKCRYCHKSLPIYYPVVEVVTGIFFVLVAFFVFDNFKFQISNFKSISNFQTIKAAVLYLGFYLYIISSLIVVFFTDLKYGIIPDKIVFPAILVTFVFLLLALSFPLYPYIFSAIGAFLFLYILHVITRGRGMGFGDVKYAFLMGLLLGFPQIVVALYIAFLTGAVVSLILIAWGKKKLKGATIPFGPFLVLGTLCSLFFGHELLSFFLRTFLHV